MDIKQKFREEKNTTVYAKDVSDASFSNVYVKWLEEQLRIGVVSNWVTTESNIPPEVCTDVMVKYKDGRTEVAYFDGDNRFYIEKDDRDVSEKIMSWHKLPE